MGAPGLERIARVADTVPLASLGQLEFGAWDIFPDNAFEAALHAHVLDLLLVWPFINGLP